MPINSSSKSKTVKTMYESMSNDSWTVDKVLLYANYENKIIVPYRTILEGYYDYFTQFLEKVSVPKKYYYLPSGFSEYYYGTPDLDFLVLYFAEMTSLFEFNKSEIKVLPKTKLTELNKLLVEYKKEVEDSKSNPDTFIESEEVEVTKYYK